VRVRGARVHNLQNVNVDIPRNTSVVFTGISGSGKSSLAFGTLYVEAQRRYFESVSPYARRLIDQVTIQDVDSLEGLPPAIALQQQRGATSSRSSVGSITTLSNPLRMLYCPRGATLYAIDEPTIGLHPADVDKLMIQLEALVDAGNTVVVTGTPQTVAAHAATKTAIYLAPLLAGSTRGVA
jgi:excinuclease UvrABC ATPase subunit